MERSAEVPLSSGIFVGLLAVVVGAVLYVAMRRKTAAVVVIGIGVTVALLTLGLVALAVHSGM
jgi:hypothetical protein